MNELATEMACALTEYLTSGATDKAISLLSDEKYKACPLEDSYDLIMAVKSFVTRNTLENAPLTFDCAKNVLLHIASKARPEEAVLELIEAGENLEDDTQMISILQPLQVVLDKLDERRGMSLMWCLNMIEHHINNLPCPPNHNLEGKEKILLDSDPAVDRIIYVYKGVDPFYRHFFSEICDKLRCTRQQELENNQVKMERNFLIRSVLFLLGKPFADLDVGNGGHVKSSSRLIAENLVSCFGTISGDCLKYLKYAEMSEIRYHKELRHMLESSSDESFEQPSNIACLRNELFGTEEEIPFIGLGVFYYLVFAEKLMEGLLPCVYHPLYIFHRGLLLSSFLIECTEMRIVNKGLLLVDAVICMIDENSLNSSSVESEVHSNFLEKLQPVLIYCNCEEYRVLALNVMRKYLNLFNRKALYLILVHLQKTAQEHSISSYLIVYIKDIIRNEMADGNYISPYFRGRMLYKLMDNYLRLSKGVETDLINEMSKITASLNFIRFMLLRDRENTTGFLNYINILKETFLSPLEEAIKMSRAHFKLKLKEEIEKKVKTKKLHSEPEIKVTVSGEVIDQKPVDALNASLTYLDLMESLLCRVNECIESL